jgi:hypothetical protein
MYLNFSLRWYTVVCLRDDANVGWKEGGPGFMSLLQNLPPLLGEFSSLQAKAG